MRLYLSSYRMGNKPDEMLPLIGDNKRVAIVMNAKDTKSAVDRADRLQRDIVELTDLGLEPEELDLRDYFGSEDKLRDAIKQFGYVWVAGGNVFLLRRAFKQSGFDEIITQLLRDDSIAYGGYSAGVCVLSPSLRGLELVDPTDVLAEGYDSNIVWDGLGILDYTMVPHYKSNHPETAVIDLCVDYFEEKSMPYKTLRDGEAIVINGLSEKLVS